MELKEIHAEMQKAFADLQTVITAGEVERKKIGDESIETKGLVDRLNKRLDDLEALANRKGVSPKSKEGDEEVSVEVKAFEKSIRFGVKELGDVMTPEEKAAFATMRTKALSEGNDAKGGVVAPEDFRIQLIKKIPNFSNVGALCNRVTTSKDTLRWPSIPYATDDISTSGVAITWEDETDGLTETDFTMGSVAVPVRKARALIKVSVELLEDASIDIVALLSDLLAQAYGIEEDRVFTKGEGGRRPIGFLTDADIASINNGHATALQYDGLVDFIYGLPEQYAGNARIMVKRSTVAALRKIKDSTGQPIWQPGMQAGAPATLLGYPMITNEHMPAIASGAKPAIFADFKQLYTVADRTGMTIKRLDEKYADTDEVGFIARRRFGGKVTAAWAAKKLNMA